MSCTRGSMEALFLPCPSGMSFCLLHVPSVPPRGAFVYVPPFAEEMNKSRRMAAIHARALAHDGWFVLQPDLFGCGDSGGAFHEATWDGWLADLVCLAEWLRNRTGFTPALWGLRAGCLLAAEVLPKLSWTPNLLFWQPVLSGKQHLQQFIRLKLAGEMLADPATGKGSLAEMRAKLLNDECVEIAGYLLSPGVALGLDKSNLLPAPAEGRLFWLEVASSVEGGMTPAASVALGKWREAGWHLQSKVVEGVPFWQTQEIEEVPALIMESLCCLEMS